MIASLLLVFASLVPAATAAPEGSEAAFAEEVAIQEIPGVPPGPPPPAEDVQQIAYEVGLKLRCPVCQGLSVADSTSPTAVAIQNTIRRLVAAGYDEQQISTFFVERYGEWIRLQPEAKGMNLLIWLLPGLAAGLGIGGAAYATVKFRSEGTGAGGTNADDGGGGPRDRYEQRLLDQLED